MDAEKWKKITATFSFTSPDGETSKHNYEASNSRRQFNSRLIDIVDKQSLPGQSSLIPHHPPKLIVDKEIVDRISVSCCGFPQHIALQREVEHLKTVLQEKCQLIDAHENTICELRSALKASYRRHKKDRKDGSSISISHSEIPNREHGTRIAGRREGEEPVGVKARGKVRHPNAPGNATSLQNVSESC